MELSARTCARCDCDRAGPLVDITTTPVDPCAWRRDTPEDPTPPVWVCEVHTEEFNQRVSFETELTPTAFVAEAVEPTLRGRVSAALRSFVPKRQRAH